MRCFTAGTAVLTADGSVAIEDIESGDLVVARAAGLGRWEALEEVPAGYPQAGDEVVRLGASGPSERVGDLGPGVTFVFENGVFQTDETGERLRWTGEVLAPVGDTMRRVARSTIEVEVAYDDGHVGTITATPEHPFLVEGQGWVPLGEVLVGDLLAVEGGRSAVVVGWVEAGGGDVYNFEVLGLHNYHVGDGVVVHNALPPRLVYDSDGIEIRHYYGGAADGARPEHAPIHFHVRDGDVRTRVRPSGQPLTAHDLPLSRRAQEIFRRNRTRFGRIERRIGRWFRSLRCP